MNRRIVTRVVRTGGVATATLINKEASEVWWITISPHVKATHGLVTIYDGFDVNGKMVWEAEPGYARPYNFIPPIHCEQGVFVQCDATIETYTIAWRPKKWDRPKPMKADIIEHPEA